MVTADRQVVTRLMSDRWSSTLRMPSTNPSADVVRPSTLGSWLTEMVRPTPTFSPIRTSSETDSTRKPRRRMRIPIRARPTSRVSVAAVVVGDFVAAGPTAASAVAVSATMVDVVLRLILRDPPSRA